MEVSVQLDGLPELGARLAHAQDGVLHLERELVPELLAATPPTLVAESVRMRARLWGAGDVWQLPSGGWLTPRVQLPDGQEALQTHVQQLLDGK